MSGATNQGPFGNSGAGPSPWGSGPWSPGGPGPWGQPGGQGGGNGWPGNAYAWWSMSRPLLIAATIIGFMFWWPIGLVMLLLAIWNKKMGRWAFGYGPGCMPRWGNAGGNGGNGGAWTPPWASWKGWSCGGGRNTPPSSSGNHAFDEYRNQTLQRLEEEQREFAAFLERLRFARDKSEFDQFMNERRQPPATTPEPPQPGN